MNPATPPMAPPIIPPRFVLSVEEFEWLALYRLAFSKNARSVVIVALVCVGVDVASTTVIVGINVVNVVSESVM